MSVFDIMDIFEPIYLIGLTLISWVIVIIVWLIAPDLVLFPLLLAIVLSLLTIFIMLVPISESGSKPKTDTKTQKSRCRVCHGYFNELVDGTCKTCSINIRDYEKELKS